MKKKFHFNFKKTAAVAALAAFLAGAAIMHTLPPSFSQAKLDKNKRKAYIEHISKKLEIPSYVNSITYVPNHLERGDFGGVYQDRVAEMATSGASGAIRDTGKRKIYSNTRVYDLAFSLSANEKEFLNKLEHEMGIARVLYEGPTNSSIDSIFFVDSAGKNKVNVQILQIIAELESYDNDISRAVSLGLSEKYITEIKSTYARHYGILLNPTLIGDKSKIEKLRKAYFRPWIKN